MTQSDAEKAKEAEMESEAGPNGVIVDGEFEALIPPLSEEEAAGLEASILTEGLRDPLVTWRGRLLDGHHRLVICRAHDISFQAREIDLPDREAAMAWIIRTQLFRRNLAPFTRAELALKLEPILASAAKRRQGTRTDLADNIPQNSAGSSGEARDELARVATVSHDTIRKAKVIVAEAPEEVKADLRAGRTSMHKEFKVLRPTKPRKPARKGGPTRSKAATTELRTTSAAASPAPAPPAEVAAVEEAIMAKVEELGKWAVKAKRSGKLGGEALERVVAAFRDAADRILEA